MDDLLKIHQDCFLNINHKHTHYCHREVTGVCGINKGALALNP